VYVISQDTISGEFILNIAKLLMIQTHQDVNKDYKLVGFGADKQIMDVKDTTGYHGVFYREDRKLTKMTFK